MASLVEILYGFDTRIPDTRSNMFLSAHGLRDCTGINACGGGLYFQPLIGGTGRCAKKRQHREQLFEAIRAA